MRMWMVDPKILCRQHLLGEHKELHMLAGCVARGKSLRGYLEKGLIQIHSIKCRHEELVEEMQRRGYNHSSPLRDFQDYSAGEVNKEKSIYDLRIRCKNCKI